MEAVKGALEPTDIGDLDGAMEAIDMDFSKNEIADKEELSAKQKKLIQQLRERVRPLLKPEYDTEAYLVKWLIARNFDLDKAEDMLKKHIRYMKVNHLDDLENYVPPEATEYFYTAKLGYDKEGSVVRVLHVGACDIRGLCYALSKMDCLKFAAYILFNDVLKQKEEMEVCRFNVTPEHHLGYWRQSRSHSKGIPETCHHNFDLLLKEQRPCFGRRTRYAENLTMAPFTSHSIGIILLITEHGQCCFTFGVLIGTVLSDWTTSGKFRGSDKDIPKHVESFDMWSYSIWMGFVKSMHI